MGGCCCCCSSRRSEPIRTPTYYYCPRTLEERQPLSAHHVAPSGLSAGLLVDTNLDISNIDTYTPPPVPIPYDVDIGRPQTPPGSRGNGAKSGTATNIADAVSTEGEITADSPGDVDKDVKEVDSKAQSILELTPSKDFEDDLKKPSEPFVTTIEEEDCPICLEEYTEENPKMVTKCEHNFHLCCILEWMERSETCPVCEEEITIDEAISG